MGSKVILLSSLAFFVFLLVAPWQRPCQVRNSPDDPLICGRTFAWEGSDFGLYAIVLAAAIFIWELLPILIPKLSMRGWPTAIVTAILSVALAVCTLVKLITDNEFQTVWAWVGFATSLAIMLTALIRVRYRWGTRHKHEAETAASVAQPGTGSGS
jgi:O-antigen/teichoic acid export membrane protein